MELDPSDYSVPPEYRHHLPSGPVPPISKEWSTARVDLRGELAKLENVIDVDWEGRPIPAPKRMNLDEGSGFDWAGCGLVLFVACVIVGAIAVPLVMAMFE